MQSQDAPVRVALILRSFEIGGAERCVANIANYLDRQRYKPMVICLTHAGAGAQWIKEADVEVVEVGIADGNAYRQWGMFADVLREHKVAIVQSHNWGTLVETAVARRRAGCPLHVHVEQGTVLSALNPTRWTRIRRGSAMRLALAFANACVAVAEPTRRRIAECSGVSVKKVRIIRNGVESLLSNNAADQRTCVRAELEIPDNEVVIGTVARLDPVKNLEALLHAAHQLVARHVPVHVVVVGDGPERQRLAACALDGPAAEQIHLVGARQDVGRWLAAMDIYVNCSVSEGTSLSLMEAMSVGLSSVVTDVGDNALLVGNGLAGHIVPNRDQEKLSTALAQLAMDKTRRDGMGNHARELFGEKHDCRMTVRRYEELFEHLLGKG